MKKPVDHSITLTLELDKVAKDFGYKLDFDSFDDVTHNGYSDKDIVKMGIMLPKELDNADQIFPSRVGASLEDAERDAYAVAIRKESLNALEQALLKIDLTGGGAEYQDMNGEMISAKAGITEVTINEAQNEITVTILNPEHLINATLNGVGLIGPDLSAFEKSEINEIKSRFHNLDDYFEVWGERKPSGELSSQYSPNINDEYFHDMIKERISELTEEEIAESVMEAVSDDKLSPKEALEIAVKLSKCDPKKIKTIILSKLDEDKNYWNENL